MTTYDVLSLVAAVLFGSLAVATALRRQEGRLTGELGLMSLFLFAYCAADGLEEVAPGPRWHGLTEVAAALAAAPAISLLAGFLGLRRRLRPLLVLMYVYFVGLALLSLGPRLHPALAGFPGSDAWAFAMLAGLVAAVAVLGPRFVRHARTSPGAERVRCYMLGAAAALGFGGVATDLASIGGLPAPRLAAIGLALAALVLGAMLLETRGLFDRPKTSALVTIVLLALVAVVGEVLVVAVSVRRTGLLVFGTVFVLISFLVAVRPLVHLVTTRRARRRYHQTLGQWVDQITHDVLNPTAAIKGAAQLVQEDLRNGAPVDPAFLQLIEKKADQLERTVRELERLARVQPDLTALDLGALIDAVVAAERAARGPSVEVVAEVEPGLPKVQADAPLLTAALENLAANAAQAMPEGGRITLRAEARRTPLGQRVVLEVEDTGPGIDPRTLERVFEPGFTTRAVGRGNGLPYVWEVVRAHQGTIRITSRLERGTRVRIELPA
ncbi:MAG: hypothetical protein H6744_21835 [Deltaproteobacteria bacterium]|nr:hypothetical protein [Deltaproteobacteria bacterium]